MKLFAVLVFLIVWPNMSGSVSKMMQYVYEPTVPFSFSTRLYSNGGRLM